MGLVIRRGPSKQVATFRWNRDTDEFQLGQWLKGRIYERRCDISPDGKYWVYFAMNGKRNTETKGSWTAVSKTPYLKALALFGKGDCWYGGGLWINANTYCLNESFVSKHFLIRDCNLVRRNKTRQISHRFGGECPGLYYPRLALDGWTLLEEEIHDAQRCCNVFEKDIFAGWILRKYAHADNSRSDKGCYWDEHELIHKETQKFLGFPHWEWADRDRDRLVWATNGKLFAANLTTTGMENETELHDFSNIKFKPLHAPY